MKRIENKSGNIINKSEVVLEYYRGKGLVDVCDLSSPYLTPLRHSLKWYRKVTFEVLFNTSVVNTLSQCNKFDNCSISITEFRLNIIISMMNKPVNVEN